jgi:HlyD family secretion protein
LQLEREAARLEGVVGRNEAESSKAQNSMAEMKMQIQQTKQKQREEVAAQLLDARQKLNDVNEKLRVAEDVFRRLDIIAPRAGVVQNVRINTVGAVVRPGEPLAEVVPLNDELIVEAQISPTDIDRIRAGEKAEVRFPNFQARATPVVMGHISIVSRDRMVDESTKMPYFLVQIAIRDTDIPKEMQGRLTAGMPAEVVVATGERTVLQFLISPLTDVFAKTFREK